MTDQTLPKAVVLTGGDNLEFLRACSEIILQTGVKVAAVIATDRCEKVIGETTRDIAAPGAPLFFSRRPWKDGEIANILKNEVAYGINIGFDYVIDEKFFRMLEVGAINLHPALLPLNRGCHHSFWGIMEKTQLGASIHWMDATLDHGDIIDQEGFEDNGFMTAKDIQNRSEALCIKLLEKNLPAILDGTAPRRAQGEGTYHSKKAIRDASTLQCGDTISVDTVLDLCRATSCKGNGFFVIRDGKRVLVRTTIEVLGNE